MLVFNMIWLCTDKQYMLLLLVLTIHTGTNEMRLRRGEGSFTSKYAYCTTDSRLSTGADLEGGSGGSGPLPPEFAE